MSSVLESLFFAVGEDGLSIEELEKINHNYQMDMES